MSKAAYKHEYEQQLAMYYFRKLTELFELWMDNPWTNDFNEAVQALIDEKPEHKKIILKVKAQVTRGDKCPA